MLGAIFGDIVGSKYEFNNIKTTEFELLDRDMCYTDDSILTIAVADWLLQSSLSKDRLVYIIKNYVRRYPHPKGGYGCSFNEWAKSENSQPYNSWGNGSAMRVSAIGWAFETLEETEAYAKLSAEITHNHPEGIKGAQATAAAIFLARQGKTKRSIKRYIQEKYRYDLNRHCDDIRPYYQFNESCQETVPEAIIAFLDSEDFESAIRLAISLGGDSDTLTAITGGIAEAFYGMEWVLPRIEGEWTKLDFREDIKKYLPRDLLAVVEEFYKSIYPKGKKFQAKNEAMTTLAEIRWTEMEFKDLPLSEEQYAVLMLSYGPSHDSKFSVYYDNGFHYIYRSYHLLMRFRYERERDGLYHLKEFYSNALHRYEMGLFYDVIFHGHFPYGAFADVQYNYLSSEHKDHLATDLDKAKFIAELSLRQYYYDGYLKHAYRVMKLGKSPDQKIVGLLHEVVQRSSWTFEKLAEVGFSSKVINALKCLNRKSINEADDELVKRISNNPLALKVKLNDLRDNMDLSNLDEITDKDIARVRSYHSVYKKLVNIK